MSLATIFGKKEDFISVPFCDYVEYDCDPKEVPEWQWIERVASYAHVNNKDDVGVYEFIVNVDVAHAMVESKDAGSIPSVFVDLFNHAKEQDISYILFFQE